MLADRPEDAAAIARHEQAAQAVVRAQAAEQQAQEDLELAREAYRTAIEAGEPTAELQAAYEQAQADFAAAQDALTAAVAQEAATRGPAEEASDRVADAVSSAAGRDRLWAFLVRLAFVSASLGASFWLLSAMRRRGSRYLAVGIAAVAASTLTAFVMAGDYLTDYFDVTDLGPLVLSLLGVALSLASLVGVQRYVQRRIPVRRVRRHECPFCGFPVGEHPSCEGCGREVIAGCASCGEPRRVGTAHCRTCGAA